MIKQVTVMRKDLKMRRGKEIAQGQHASISFITKRLKLAPAGKLSNGEEVHEAVFTKDELEWINGSFTKICLQVSSEIELMGIYQHASSIGLEVHLITDAGRTEFNNVPTRTCLAIGPDTDERINKVTGHLKLY